MSQSCLFCHHAHIGSTVCGYSTGRDNVCLCQVKNREET